MLPVTVIRSRQNPTYKQFRSLLRRDRRHEERAFLVEGRRFVTDALRFGAVPSRIAISESFRDTPSLSPIDPAVFVVLDDELFASISDTVTSQGIIGVFPIPTSDILPDDIPFIVVADGIQDPGNLGTLIRSAAGAGATRILVLPGTVDPWAPKTVRAAAAAHFQVSIIEIRQAELAKHIPVGTRVIGASADASTIYDRIDLTGPIVLVIGSEGSGLSKASRALLDDEVAIPLANGIESLNAGVAASIIVFEASRQRRTQPRIVETPSV